MSLARPYGAGLRNVGSYQVSGQPYLSGSITSAATGSVLSSDFSFPFVTKKIKLTNNDSVNNAMVSFVPYIGSEATSEGYSNDCSGSGNWLFLSASSTIDLDVKCKRIFVAPAHGNHAAGTVNTVTLYAELTNIDTSSMYELDGLEGVSSYVSNPHPANLARPYGTGLRNVGSYQVSGKPYITGSALDSPQNVIVVNLEKQIKLPNVAKSITLWNHSTGLARLRFHLVSSSSITNHPASRHFYELSANESLTVNMKCKEFWLSAVSGDVSWKMYASLTNIPTGSMYDLTGSGISS